MSSTKVVHLTFKAKRNVDFAAAKAWAIANGARPRIYTVLLPAVPVDKAHEKINTFEANGLAFDYAIGPAGCIVSLDEVCKLT